MSDLRENYKSSRMDDKAFIILHANEIVNTIEAFKNMLKSESGKKISIGFTKGKNSSDVYSRLEEMQSKIKDNPEEFCNNAKNKKELGMLLKDVFTMQDILEMEAEDPDILKHVKIIERPDAKTVSKWIIIYIVVILALTAGHIAATHGAYLPEFLRLLFFIN
ncbi:MAG: hypothetical protein K6A23_10995 [Butyrivibrio sp.]|nr:hypothetical protein [Butyrivibrio sp.]